MRLRLGFYYEQAEPSEPERMRGFYITDADTGLVVMSEDVEPTSELISKLKRLEIDV